ncbi:MAG: FAD-dependent oxidoreductase [Sphingomonadales bacterium]
MDFPDPEDSYIVPDGGALAERAEQMFPALTAKQIGRIERLGERMTFAPGAFLFEQGKPAPGFFILLSGWVHITNRDVGSHDVTVVEQGPGQFIAEVGQLAGRPALVDGRAKDAVEAILLKPEALRQLLIVDAAIGEMVMRALILRRVALIERGAGGPILIGTAGMPDLVRLETFCARNGMPRTVLDPQSDADALALIERFHVSDDDLPLAVCPSGDVLRNPTDLALAHCLGLDTIDTSKTFDVAIVGAGPAGLAAAVYAASEGLSVVVLDARAYGGQAGASARIENYLGFPSGISGQALAGRAYTQAQKFGAQIAIPVTVERLDCSRKTPSLVLGDGRRVRARSVIVASGAAYRRPAVQGLQRYEGRGISYWVSPIEARLVSGQEVALVGGGNSAGQAVVFLANHCTKVNMVVRRPLATTMSNYLIERIDALPNVSVNVGAEISALHGDREGLSGVTWRNRDTEKEFSCDTRHLFLFIGADPNSAWFGECDAIRDRQGFVMTGDALEESALKWAGWHLERSPMPLETSIPGVFAIGDVRAGSVKRVAAGVGEGAAVVAQLHGYLAGIEG